MASRQVWCGQCREKKVPGTREIYEAADFEPAEYERVTYGIAKQPLQSQREMSINGEVMTLDSSHFNCDNCNAPIQPGKPCAGWTVWKEGQLEPGPWETHYMLPAEYEIPKKSS